MKILTAKQIRAVEEKTAEIQGIEMIDLMDRAAHSIYKWLEDFFDLNFQNFTIICGSGNNGGDGLALACLLHKRGTFVQVYLKKNEKYSPDNLINQKRLKTIGVEVEYFDENVSFEFEDDTVILDCLFGVGLTRPLNPAWQKIISQINESQKHIISIDLPSGLLSNEYSSKENPIVKSDVTLTFEYPKLALLQPENEMFAPRFEVLTIDLEEQLYQEQDTDFYYTQGVDIQYFNSSRKKYSHKGTYGHALIIGGSYGKIGSTVLAAKAALKTGCGLVSAYLPKCGYEVMQTAFPEAMVLTDFSEDKIISFPEVKNFDAIGIGVGMGTDKKTLRALEEFILENDFEEQGFVFDADALNLISTDKTFVKQLPKNSILTPHPKELERLIGKWENDFDKIEKVRTYSAENQIVVVVKGAHTSIFTPEKKVYINSTGNPGMATAGSGDALTGIITGLLAKGISPEKAAIYGVYIHGLAGDVAADKIGAESLIASDIINNIYEVL